MRVATAEEMIAGFRFVLKNTAACGLASDDVVLYGKAKQILFLFMDYDGYYHYTITLQL